jgi:hypothetical protein
MQQQQDPAAVSNSRTSGLSFANNKNRHRAKHGVIITSAYRGGWL